MRPLIDTTVPDLPAPPADLLDAAREPPATPERHAACVRDVEALHLVEAQAPSVTRAWPGRLRVAAFNAQRLEAPEATRTLLERAGAHAALLSEVDLGMARSGNGHPVREMADASGIGYLYGVEFVELDLGNAEEMRLYAGEQNRLGFHGNALATGLALADPHIVPLEESGFWFPGHEGAERRIGGRIAVVARVADAPRPLWLASLHLESKTDPADRRAQIQALLRAVERLGPDDAWILGGDLNTKALSHDPAEAERLLDDPGRHEPLFRDLAEAGFTWVGANQPAPTQRTGRHGRPKPPFAKLDWLVVRGMKAAAPEVLPALDPDGQPISDHEMIAAEFFFEEEPGRP